MASEDSNLKSLESSQNDKRGPPTNTSEFKDRPQRIQDARKQNRCVSEYFGTGDVLSIMEARCQLGERLSESIHVHAPCNGPAYAKAVFRCTFDLSDGSAPSLGILKVYMQISSTPQETLSRSINIEVQALKKIRECKTLSGKTRAEAYWHEGADDDEDLCDQAPSRDWSGLHSPGILGFDVRCQSMDMWIPGGFVAFLAMNEIPGEPLVEILQRERLSQEEVRDIQTSFSESCSNLADAGIEPADRDMRNLLWDRERKICSIVDFEEAQFPAKPLEFDPMNEWVKWKLSFEDLARLHEQLVQRPEPQPRACECWRCEPFQALVAKARY